jgi:phenylacetate-coenzyme A ligase PaaK-like adenylate-forming protein
MTTYCELRQKHTAEMRSLFPEYIGRLSWPADRLRQEREERLRALVRVAQERSPWHRRRLTGIDPASLTEADLERIPPMTKVDLMAHWDEIVTDPRLTLDLVNAHLSTLSSDRYLFDRYHAIASGGSTGTRGVFVYDWTSWMLLCLTLFRRVVRGAASDPKSSQPPIKAHVSASKATHLSSAIVQTFFDSHDTHRFPITLPLNEIVDGLNEVRATYLMGYPSAFNLLANEARAGRLRISPCFVGCTAEPLLPEIRRAIEEVWGVPAANKWACSEGGAAESCGQGQGMHLDDDLTIVEPVDAEGRPVPPGVRSAKIYLTNLYNCTLPLIRYEITDEMTFIDEPCPCGSAHRRIEDVQGRLDESFSYASGVQVHPHLFRSALGDEPNVLEYQVRQTRRGAAIALRCTGDVDVPRLHSEIAEGLAMLGLEDPDLSIAHVDQFERQATGKLKRFFPLPTPS